MTTTPTVAPWYVTPADPGSTAPSADADDLPSALAAAWALNRHTEAPVRIYDRRDLPATPAGKKVPLGRHVATLSLEWHE